MATYFFDSYLPVRFAAMLSALDVAVEHLLAGVDIDHGVVPTDEEWLPSLRNRDVVLVTIDRFTKRGSVADLALRDSGVTAIFLPKGFETLDRWAQATWLIRHWQTIEEVTRRLTPGTWAQASLGGSIESIDIS